MATFRKPVIQLVTPLDYIKDKSSLKYGKVQIYYKMGTLSGDKIINESIEWTYQKDDWEPITLDSNEGWITIEENAYYTFSHKVNDDIHSRTIFIDGIVTGYPELPFIIGMNDTNVFNTNREEDKKWTDIGNGNKYEASFLIAEPSESCNENVTIAYYPYDNENPLTPETVPTIEEITLNYNPVLGDDGRPLWEDFNFHIIDRKEFKGMYYLMIERSNDYGITRYIREFHVSDGIIYASYSGEKPSGIDYCQGGAINAEFTASSVEGNSYTDISNMKFEILDNERLYKPIPAGWENKEETTSVAKTIKATNQTTVLTFIPYNISYKIEFDATSYELDQNGQPLGTRKNIIFGNITWLNGMYIPPVKFFYPVEGMESGISADVVIESVDGYKDIVEAYNVSTDSVKALTKGGNQISVPNHPDASTYTPRITGRGDYVIKVTRTPIDINSGDGSTDGNPEMGGEERPKELIATRHFNLIEKGTIGVRFININEGATYVDAITPKIRITLDDMSKLNDVNILASYTREYEGNTNTVNINIDVEGKTVNNPTPITEPGSYTVDVRCELADSAAPGGIISATDSISFSIDNGEPEVPFIIGIAEGNEYMNSVSWKVKKNPYTSTRITLTNKSEGWSIEPVYSIVNEDGIQYYSGTISGQGSYSMHAINSKTTNGKTAEYSLNDFKVVDNWIAQYIIVEDQGKKTYGKYVTCKYPKATPSTSPTTESGLSQESYVLDEAFFHHPDIRFYDIPGRYQTFDKTWDPYSKSAVYPGSNIATPLEPYGIGYETDIVKFLVIDNSLPGTKSLSVSTILNEWMGPEGSGWGLWPKYSVSTENYEMGQIRGCHHAVPGKPLLSVKYFDGGATITVENMDRTNYRYICRMDGKFVSDTFGNKFTTTVEGKHNFHVVVTDPISYRENHADISFIVYKRRPIPAPCIAVRKHEQAVGFDTSRPTDPHNGTEIPVDIHYHPFSEAESYEILYTPEKMDPQSIDVFSDDVDKILKTITYESERGTTSSTYYDINKKLSVYDNCIIHADSTPINPHTNKLDVANDCRRFSKCCINANPEACSNSWATGYKEMLDLGRFWNIEYSYYPEWQRETIGVEYRTIDNIVRWEGDGTNVEKPGGEGGYNDDLTEIIYDPKIIGLYPRLDGKSPSDDRNREQFSAYPHTKRNFYQSYYSYVDRVPYELGDPIDDTWRNKKMTHYIDIGTEYRKYGVIRKWNIHDRRYFNIDDVYPPYPKLTKDIESIMTEPFQINILNESVNGQNVIYTPVLYKDGEEYINPQTNKRFKFGEYVFEDGEYTLDVYAYRVLNRTFRHKSFKFTINTFQHIPLNDMMTKVLPRQIENIEDAREGELLIDKQTGHYGIWENNIYNSPTMDLEEKLIQTQETVNNIQKIYNDLQDRIEDIYERYIANKDSIDKFISHAEETIEKSENVREEYKKLVDTVNGDRSSTETLIADMWAGKRAADQVIADARAFISEIDGDRWTWIIIIRREVMDAFSEIRGVKTMNHICRKMLKTKKTKSDFASFKSQCEAKYNTAANAAASWHAGPGHPPKEDGKK